MFLWPCFHPRPARWPLGILIINNDFLEFSIRVKFWLNKIWVRGVTSEEDSEFGDKLAPVVWAACWWVEKEVCWEMQRAICEGESEDKLEVDEGVYTHAGYADSCWGEGS